MLLSLSMKLSFLLCVCVIFTTSALASVPSDQTFIHANEGDFGDFIVEYDATYRVLPISSGPFQLCFYNTTPNAFTFALRIGTSRSESLRRWVWEANRGNPVGENATLTFSANGNLVLADADGRIAWQTNTANKGVVGFQLLENGNMVLVDSNGKYIWQSFDYPTDTLLVGQSLKRGAKLVSRVSEVENSDGPYSLVFEKNLNMYYNTLNSPKPLLYYSFKDLFVVSDIQYLTLGPELTLDFGGGSFILGRARYNTTFTYLRLGIDGNIKLYTYDNEADWSAWDVTFTLFDRSGSWETECQLPERCGNFGLCEDNQCVACPSPKGLLGWSKNCQPPRLTSCDVKGFSYIKMEGVDHFMTKYTTGNGPVKQDDCGNKCTRDCKCLGYFYHTQSSRCWLAYDLKTLTKFGNSTHLAYIKAPIASQLKFPVVDII